MIELREWLEEHGLGKYADLLAENEVDFEVLPELEESDLEGLGLALGPRKKLLKAIRELEASQIGDSTASLAPRPSSTGEAERRQLTVMFADLVGSTELSRELDPEDLRDINRAYQDAATAAIEKFGGYVARYMGDGLLAYFGYPQAHEDDAERALRAGLEVIDSVSALEMEVALAVRVGIATGSVVVGDIVGEGAAQESAVIGETPNLAARLQGIAEPNAVVLSAATRQLVSGRFELDELGPQTLKGIDQPVPAYRALAVRDVSRFDAVREQRYTPLVGRVEELAMLERRWGLAVEGEGQVVLLSGEAGVGKSRIVRALEDAIGEALDNRVLYFCSPYHRSSAFHPVIEQAERAIGIGHGQTARQKLDAIENALRGLGFDVDETAPFFAELLSIPCEGVYPALDLAPEQLRLRLLDVLGEGVEAMAVQGPVLFVVEDVHWVDPSTQDFLSNLIERVRSSRTLIVITHRPEYEPPWTGYAHVTAISLNNLGNRDSAAMVAAMTKGRGIPQSMVDEIIHRTDGVPLFIEEVTASLGEVGFTARDDGADIPTTLQDLLMERLDRMGPAKELAQHAAVIGRSFTLDLLEAVSGTDARALDRDLEELVHAGLVYRRGGATSSYEFKHALVRDAAYQSLLRRERQACHHRVATALTQAAEDNPPLELMAHHFEEGGDLDRAARLWREAGGRALGRFAHVEAISDFRRALHAVDSLPANRDRFRFELETQTLLGPALMQVLGQGAPEVEQNYLRALELSEQLDDSDASFTSAWGLWRLQFARGDMNAARDYALKCRLVSAGSADRIAKLGTSFALGATYTFKGECAEAEPHLEASNELYRSMEDKSALAVFGQDPGLSGLGYLAWVRWSLGFPDQAIAPCEEAVQLARDIGKPALIAVATGFAGLTYSLRRDIPRMTEYAGECVSICDEYEFRQWAAMSNVLLGYACSHDGDHDRATALASGGLDEKAALNSYIAAPWFSYLTAETFVAAGRPQEALDFARRGIAFATRGAEGFFESESHRIQAVILAGDADASRADVEAHLDNALQLARSQKSRSLELRAAMSIARLAEERRARKRARGLLEPLYASFTEGFDTADLMEAKALLDELS